MLDLRSVSHIVMLNEERSFVRAAARLGVTQPALSRSLQQIEAAYGVRLFDRSRSGVVPTSACVALLPEAARILADARALDRTLRDVGKAEAGKVSIGMGPIPTVALLPQLLVRLLRERPGITVDVTVASGPEVVRRTLNDELDFCCSADIMIPRHERYDCLPLVTLPLALLVRADHPLTRGEGCVEDYPLIGGSNLAGSRQSYDPHIRCDDNGVLAAVLLESDAVWWTAPSSARADINAGRIVALRERFPGVDEIRYVLTRHQGRTLSPAAQYVERLVRRLASDLLR